MKAKVIIENGNIGIILNTENEFEKEVLENVYENKYEITKTNIKITRYSKSLYSHYSIIININEKQLKTKQ